VIRNVVIHISNEQPLLADLFSVPTPADVGMVCTNVRMMDGKKPIFIDRPDSTFFFPNLHIRFLEIPAVEVARHLAQGGAAPGSPTFASGTTAAVDPASVDPHQRLPIALGAGAELEVEEVPTPDQEADLDIDEDFLQRVRDI